MCSLLHGICVHSHCPEGGYRRTAFLPLDGPALQSQSVIHSLIASGGFNLCCSSCQFKVCFLVAVWVARVNGMVAKAIVCIIGKSRSSSRRLFIAFVYPVCCSCFVTVTSHHPPTNNDCRDCRSLEQHILWNIPSG